MFNRLFGGNKALKSPFPKEYEQDLGCTPKKADVETSLFNTTSIATPDNWSDAQKQTLSRHLNICYIMLHDKQILARVARANLLIALRIRTKSLLRSILPPPLVESTLEKLSEDLLYLISHRDNHDFNKYPQHAEKLMKHLGIANFDDAKLPACAEAINALLTALTLTPINFELLQDAVQKIRAWKFSLDETIFILKSITHFSSFKISHLLLHCSYQVEQLVDVSTDLLTTKGIKAAFIVHCYETKITKLTDDKVIDHTDSDDEVIVGSPPEYKKSLLDDYPRYNKAIATVQKQSRSYSSTFREDSCISAPQNIFAQRLTREKQHVQPPRDLYYSAIHTDFVPRAPYYSARHTRAASDFVPRDPYYSAIHTRAASALNYPRHHESFQPATSTNRISPITDRYGKTLGYRVVNQAKLRVEIIPNPTVAIPEKQQSSGVYKTLTHRSTNTTGENWGNGWEKRSPERQKRNTKLLEKILPPDHTALTTPPQLASVALKYKADITEDAIQRDLNPIVNEIIFKYGYPFIYVNVLTNETGERILVSRDVGPNLRTKIETKTPEYIFSLDHFELLAQHLDEAYKKHKLCHRDIKPENIGFDGKNVCLFDWGFALAKNELGSSVGPTKIPACTPSYLSNTLYKKIHLICNLNNDEVWALYHVQDMFCFLVTVFLAYSKQVLQNKQTISYLIEQDKGLKLNSFIDTCIKPEHKELVKQFLLPVNTENNTEALHEASFEKMAKLKLHDLFIWPQ